MRAAHSLAPTFIVALVLSLTTHCRADFIVAPGFDLLDTRSAIFDFGELTNAPPELQNLGLQPFRGVRIDSFDFGGTTGVVHGLGTTSAIVRRLQEANNPGNALPSVTIPLEMVALSLRSESALDLSSIGGSTNERVLVSLDQDSGNSNMTISFDDMNVGLFDSVLDFSIVFEGEDSGIMIEGIPIRLESFGSTWTREPRPGTPLIMGVNHLLNGIDTTHDFFTGIARHGPDHVHRTITANPEPSTIILVGLGGIGIVGFRQVRKRWA